MYVLTHTQTSSLTYTLLYLYLYIYTYMYIITENHIAPPSACFNLFQIESTVNTA